MKESLFISSFQTNQIATSITVSRSNYSPESPGSVYATVYDGEGSISFIDGSHYKGNLQNGCFHGKGQYTYGDGTVIQMDFKENRFDGLAKYITKKE